MPSFVKTVLFSILAATSFSAAQDGYVGYNISAEGDGSAIYATDNGATSNGSLTNPPPDVFLNASVHVGEIDILVANLTASVNLEAQVLSLLEFNAGVDVSIDRVSLTIQNISAAVTLEARLENLVLMIGDVLDSIDLNPVIATLASGVSSVIDETTGLLTGDSSSSSALSARSLEIEKGILYSINDYSGNAHTNRILEQTGTIIDQSLHNDGTVYGERVVGSYLDQMTFAGHNITTTRNGKTVQEQEYTYSPLPGVSVIAAIYTDESGKVVGTQILMESSGGGSSTIFETEE